MTCHGLKLPSRWRMDSKDALVVFEGKKVRRTWNNNEWWFVLEDIVYILTDSSDSILKRTRMLQKKEELLPEWQEKN